MARTNNRTNRRPNNNDRKIKKFNSKMQASLLLVFSIVIVFFLILIGRLVYINVHDGDRYTKQVLSQQTYNYSVIPYKRGDIYDRNGTVLAKSVKVYNLIIDPVILLEKETYKEPTLNALVEAFGIDRAEVEKVLAEKKTSRYVVFEKGYTYEQVQAFEAIKAAVKKEKKADLVQGIWFEDDFVRTYPLKTVASNTIGFTFAGNVGNSGIEGYYNSTLNGTNGSTYGYFDADLNLDRVVKPAINGNNIISTIDSNVQAIVEKHIDAFNSDVGAKNVAVMVMDPNNGEILTMASSSRYDLNNPRDLTAYYTQEEIDAMSQEEQQNALNQIWRNFAVSDIYEPGSTIKPLTVASALDEGITYDGEHFFCEGYETISGGKIKCASYKRGGHKDITLSQTIAYSCNSAMMQISAKMGRTLFSKYQNEFGLGSKTGIDLSGEASGLIFSEEKLNGAELATSSFGQSLNVTMVQLMAADNSIINGGFYYTPHVVKRITTETGAVVQEMDDNLVRRTISEETSALLRQYMRETVTDGTGKGAAVEGYDIGGKTGTAEKLPRSEYRYVLSFYGFAPVEDPKVSIYVVIDDYQSEDRAKRSDSGLATKLAGEILSEILPFLEVYPSTAVEDGDGVIDEETTEENTEYLQEILSDYTSIFFPETADEGSINIANPESMDPDGDNTATVTPAPTATTKPNTTQAPTASPTKKP